jgi:septum formation topological specificity factor MinE
MNRKLLAEMRRQLLQIVQKHAGWMSEEQLIQLSRDIGEATDKLENIA